MNISRWPKTDNRWYLGVRCQKCRVPILFALDRSDGESVPARTGKLILTCALEKCGHQADYSGATVSRFQKQSDHAVEETPIENESSPKRQRKRQA